MLSFAANQITAVVLGMMQDGGLPHIGGRSRRNLAAFEQPERMQYAACLGIVDTRYEVSAIWLIDATPDIKYQLNLLAGVLGPHPARLERLRQPDGILLTHAHMGHIGGLPQLGPEGMAVDQLPVCASPRLCDLLNETHLWAPLIQRLNLLPVAAGASVTLAPFLQVTAVPVPHRDEWNTGTYAYHIEGLNKSLLYLPDIDAWEAWPEAEAHLSAVDYALVDASFYSADELGGRAPVAHPLVPETLALAAGLPCQVVLTHLNHTNPVLDEGSVARTAVVDAGVQIAFTGQQFIL
jgi:pyrroloquinoline quinone biosynthesis protein B